MSHQGTHQVDYCIGREKHGELASSICKIIMGREATALVKELASMTASQWRTTYSKVCGHFKAQMSIAVLHAPTHSCLQGSRVPAKNFSLKMFMHMEDDGADLGLMHYAY